MWEIKHQIRNLEDLKQNIESQILQTKNLIGLDGRSENNTRNREDIDKMTQIIGRPLQGQ